MAHELGHNFGMEHDFSQKHGGNGNMFPRISTNVCYDQGIMTYGHSDEPYWSTCSVDDFKQHYQEKGWGTGCLSDVGRGIYLPIYLFTYQKQIIY